ncbi:hypothetical protein Esti_005418 [Eimeria stiedai]
MTVLLVGRWGSRLRLHLLLLHLLLLLHHAAAAGEDEALEGEDTEQQIPFLAENWELTKKLSRRVLSRPLKTVGDGAAAAGGKEGAESAKGKRALHALQQQPREALQLLRGDTTLTTKHLEKERRQRKWERLQRENTAMEGSRQAAEIRFSQEIDIAERQTRPFKPNRLKRLYKLIVYFLTNGGKLPEDDYFVDVTQATGHRMQQRCRLLLLHLLLLLQRRLCSSSSLFPLDKF